MHSLFRRIAAASEVASRSTLAVTVATLSLILTISTSNPAAAMNIQKIKTPGGIEAWLVEEHSVPLMALRYAFDGGSSQDPVGKEGVANFITAMMDEGAGDLKSEDYQERMEDLAMRMSYEDSKDALYGSFETLTRQPRQGGRAAEAFGAEPALRYRRSRPHPSAAAGKPRLRRQGPR